MYFIKEDWFKNEESPKLIVCPTISLLHKPEDMLCYILSLDLYPKFQPDLIRYSYVLENALGDNPTGYFQVCGNNYHTFGHFQFKIVKEKQ